jgi:hypothetical protein
MVPNSPLQSSQAKPSQPHQHYHLLPASRGWHWIGWLTADSLPTSPTCFPSHNPILVALNAPLKYVGHFFLVWLLVTKIGIGRFLANILLLFFPFVIVWIHNSRNVASICFFFFLCLLLLGLVWACHLLFLFLFY